LKSNQTAARFDYWVSHPAKQDRKQTSPAELQSHHRLPFTKLHLRMYQKSMDIRLAAMTESLFLRFLSGEAAFYQSASRID